MLLRQFREKSIAAITLIDNRQHYFISQRQGQLVDLAASGDEYFFFIFQEPEAPPQGSIQFHSRMAKLPDPD